MIHILKNEKDHQLFFLNTCETTLALFVPENGHVFIPHWGGRIEPADIGYVIEEITRASYLPDADGKKDFKLEQMPQIYPSYGYTDLREPAFSFRWKERSMLSCNCWIKEFSANLVLGYSSSCVGRYLLLPNSILF